MTTSQILLKTFLLSIVIYETFGVISFNDMKRNLIKKIPLEEKRDIFFQKVIVDLNKDGYVDNYEVEHLLGQYWTPEDIDFFMSHCEEIEEDGGLSVQEFFISIRIFTGYFRRCSKSTICPVNITKKVKKEL